MNRGTASNRLFIFALAAMLTACTTQGTDRNTKQSTGEYVDDVVITSKVKAALLKDDEVEGLDVKVETFRGVVQLGGFVNSREDRKRAAAIASKVAGVRSVKNDIRLKDDP